MKKCKQCLGEVPKAAKKCQHCGSKLDPPMWAQCCAIIVVIFIVAIAMGGFSSDKSTPPNSASTTSISIGDDGVLNAGSESVYVAVTKADLDAFIKASIAKDTYGMAEMVLGGLVFEVPNDTKVKIIDSTVGTRKIRIMGGKYIGNTGWVPYEFIKKQ